MVASVKMWKLSKGMNAFARNCNLIIWMYLNIYFTGCWNIKCTHANSCKDFKKQKPQYLFFPPLLSLGFFVPITHLCCWEIHHPRLSARSEVSLTPAAGVHTWDVRCWIWQTGVTHPPAAYVTSRADRKKNLLHQSQEGREGMVLTILKNSLILHKVHVVMAKCKSLL